MTDSLKLLEEKVSKVLSRLEEIKAENRTLKEENRALQRETTGLKQQFDQLKLDQNDQSDKVRTKLASLLGRIEELEKLGL